LAGLGVVDFGVVVGVVVGVVGFVVGLVVGFVVGLVVGFVVGFVVGAVVGFVVGEEEVGIGEVGVSKQVPGGAVSLLLHTPFMGLKTRS